MIEEGCFTGGNCPFGYTFVKSGIVTKKGRELVRLEKVPEEVEIVKFIYSKTVKDGYGTFRISDELNRRGIKTHLGAKFQPNNINRILRNKIYLGIYERAGKSSPVNEELKIIEEDEFNEAQKILQARKKENTRKSNIAYTTRGKSLLSGNVFCGHCGAKMYAITYSDSYIMANGERKVYKGIKYCCPNKARKRGECDGMTQYVSSKVESAVLEVVHMALSKIKGKAKDEAIKNRCEKTVHLKKEIYNSLTKDYIKEQDIMKKLVEEVGKALIGESKFSVELLNQSISSSKEKLAELERKMPIALKDYQNETEILKSLNSFYVKFMSWADEFDCATQEQKKMIICKLIERIEVKKGYDIHIKLNMNYEQFIA